LRDFCFDLASKQLSGSVRAYAWVLDDGISVFEDTREASWLLESSLESPQAFAQEAVSKVVGLARSLVERVRDFYSSEAGEVFKAVRLPLPLYSDAIDWEPDYVSVMQSLDQL